VECWPASTAEEPEQPSFFSVFAARADRPVDSSRIRFGAVAHEEKNSGRRYRRHTRKLLMSPRNEREFPSGSRMGPAEFVDRFKQNVRAGTFDVASIGLPAPMRNGRIHKGPKHWEKAGSASICESARIPVRVVNDAAMQALGSYRGDGRMLFLGLGPAWAQLWSGTKSDAA